MKLILNSLAGGLKKIGSHPTPRRPGRPRRRPPAGLKPQAEELESRLAPAVITWIGGDYSRTDGDVRAHPADPNAPFEWSNPLNWLGEVVPGATDTALFTANTGSYTFSDVDPDGHGGTITDTPIQRSGPSNLTPLLDVPVTIAGLSVDSSAIGFDLTIGAAQSLMLTGASQWNVGVIHLNGQVLTNTGTLTLAGASGVVLTGTGAAGASELDNQGTVAFTGTGGLFMDSANVANATTLLNEPGHTVTFQADASIAGVASNLAGGTFTNNGTLSKTGGGGTSSLLNNIAFDNSNVIDVESGTIAIADNAGVNTGGTFTFANHGILDLTGGNRPQYQGSYTASGTGTVLVQNGTLNLAGNATFNFPSPLFQWTGGTIALNGNVLTNSGTLSLANASRVVLTGTGAAGASELDNQGTVAFTGTGGLFMDSANVANATTLLNELGHTVTFQADASINSNFGGGTFINNGTLSKTAGSGTSALLNSINGIAFDNSNIIDVESGTIAIADNAGVNTGGTFTFANHGILDLTGGNRPQYQGSYTASGTGTVLVQNGTLNLAGNATFNFPSPLFQWTGGTIALNGNVLTNSGTLSLSNPSPVVLTGTGQPGVSELDNQGTIALTKAGGLLLDSSNIGDATTLLNDTTGVVSLQAAANFSTSFGGGTFSNLGTVNKTAGSGVSNLHSGALNQVSGTTLTGGTWNVFANATLTLGSAKVVTNNANITLSGPGSVFSTIANLATNNGSFILLGGQGFTTVGDLANNGSITLGPGDTLTVRGNYTHGSAANLNIQLGGSSAGQFGVLVATKALNLNGNGNLNVSLVNGFTPNTGDSFKVLIFASRNGDFAAKNGLVISPSLSLEPVYHSGDLTLVANAPPRVASFVINDGNVQRSMINSLTITFSTVVTLDSGAIEVDLQGGGQEGIVVNTSVVNGQTVAVVTFTGADIIGGSLADGRYTLIVHSSLVHTAAGQTLDGAGSGQAGSDHVEHFFRLFGDVNGDGQVDNFDLAFLRHAFGSRRGNANYLWFLDYNQDGVIDSTDYTQFKLRYGKRI